MMQTPTHNMISSRATFGLFEADLKTGELWKAGHRIKMQGLPFKVLKMLLERAGEVVTRDELKVSVWGPDVVVDYEHALSNAIKKLREALGDSADNPRFIETLSRRGFRFIAPIAFSVAPAQPIQSLTEEDAFAALLPVQPPDSASGGLSGDENLRLPSASPNRYPVAVLSALLVCVVAGWALQLWQIHAHPSVPPHIAQITQDGTIYAPKVPLLGTLSAIATDGAHLFTPSNENGNIVLSQISISTGAIQTLALPGYLGVPEIEDISPDGTQLLLRGGLAASSQQPLWIVPIDGGSAFKVSDVQAQAATWMPDGRHILYTADNQLAVVSLDNGKSTALATVPGRAFWPRWSPDGSVLRFTMIDTLNHTSALWQLSKGQTVAHQILTSWSDAGSECCGAWTASGKQYVFEATREGSADLWKLDGASESNPIRITNGPLNFKAPVASRTGEEIFFIGQDIHSRLEQYDAAQKQYVPVVGFLALADHVSYSRDGRWVAWVDSNSRLWRARSDGTDKVLLTSSSLQVLMASWSPDDTELAFMARAPKRPWQVYTVRAEGGTPERLTQENRNLGDPSFSADGKNLVFGIIRELMSAGDASSSLQLMDLGTHRITNLASSQGMYSPHWSPNGRYIAALTMETKQIMLYDTKTGAWKKMTDLPADHPIWSNDSKTLYFHSYSADKKPIYRMRITDGSTEVVANVSNFHNGSITLANFAGVTPDGAPLMHAQISSGDLLKLDLQQK